MSRDIFDSSLGHLCLHYAPVAIAVFDKELRYLAVSNRWLNNYNLKDKNIIGQHHYDVFPDIPQRWKDIHKRCLSGEVMHCDADPFVREDGKTEWINWDIRPWYDDSDDIAGIVMFADVITAQKNLEFMNKELEERVRVRTNQLEKIKNRAEQENHAKTECLSRMSHEFRTPLNAIMGFSQLLNMQNDSLEHNQKEAIGEIYKCSQYLLDVVNEVLDLSRIEAGQVDLDMQPVSLSRTIMEVNSMVSQLAKNAGINYVSGSPDDLPEVMVDEFRFKEMLINILANGVKYNRDNGSLTMRINNDSNDYVKIDVIDTGEGIKRENLERIFEPFHRVRTQKRIEGTGVGLALVKKYAELMNCEVGVDSEPGMGSRFWLKVPVARQVRMIN